MLRIVIINILLLQAAVLINGWMFGGGGGGSGSGSGSGDASKEASLTTTPSSVTTTTPATTSNDKELHERPMIKPDESKIDAKEDEDFRGESADHMFEGISGLDKGRVAHMKSFLGPLEEEFSQLDDESKAHMLLSIVHEIDANEDDTISEKELADHLWRIARKRMRKEAARQWQVATGHSANPNKLLWSDYKRLVWKDIERRTAANDQLSRELGHHLARWRTADQDGDGYLDSTEFSSYLFPELDERMHDVAVREQFADGYDHNHDGKLTFHEFLDTMYTHPERHLNDQFERKIFKEIDKDRDNHWNVREAATYFMGPSLHRDEAAHMIHDADLDHDQRLTVDELLRNANLFTGVHLHDWYDFKDEL